MATGLQPPVFRVHVCGPTCDQKRSNQDILIHLISFKKVPPPGERKWEENLKDTDENPELRRRQEEWVAQQKAAEGDHRDSSHSRASSKKKKKKRSKEKKARKKAQQGRIGGKTVAKKKLVDLYSGTGLDPDPKVRRKLQRQMRKRLKRGKGSTSTSSSTSSGTSEGKEDDELLEDRSKIQKLADHGPGLLAAAVIRNMKPFVVQTTGGTWDHRYGLPTSYHEPICSVLPISEIKWRTPPGGLHTGPHRRPTFDGAAKRKRWMRWGSGSKALELMMGGQHWSTGSTSRSSSPDGGNDVIEGRATTCSKGRQTWTPGSKGRVPSGRKARGRPRRRSARREKRKAKDRASRRTKGKRAPDSEGAEAS